MGLDIFFNRRTSDKDLIQKHTDLVNQLNELDRQVENSTPEERDSLQKEIDDVIEQLENDKFSEEVAYFRKVNFLLPYFHYGENGDDAEISRGMVDELINDCNRVLDNHELAEELLPTEGGFFFGNTDYNDNYFMAVEMVRDKFDELLKTFDWDNFVLVMHCWW